MAQPGQSTWWRIDEGGFPNCPVGSVVSFVNGPDSANVIRQGVGPIGTIHTSTTSQVASADGQSITLTNPSEGWRAVLTRTSAWQLPVAYPMKYCQTCGAQIDGRAQACPTCGAAQPWFALAPAKSRMVAAALALILGSFGLHKFYLGNFALGVIYLIFFWSGIPGLVAWIEGISYLARSNESWAQEYGGPIQVTNPLAAGCLWIIALLPLIGIVLILGLIFLGGQVSEIPR